MNESGNNELIQREAQRSAAFKLLRSAIPFSNAPNDLQDSAPQTSGIRGLAPTDLEIVVNILDQIDPSLMVSFSQTVVTLHHLGEIAADDWYQLLLDGVQLATTAEYLRHVQVGEGLSAQRESLQSELHSTTASIDNPPRPFEHRIALQNNVPAKVIMLAEVRQSPFPSLDPTVANQLLTAATNVIELSRQLDNIEGDSLDAERKYLAAKLAFEQQYLELEIKEIIKKYPVSNKQ